MRGWILYRCKPKLHMHEHVVRLDSTALVRKSHACGSPLARHEMMSQLDSGAGFILNPLSCWARVGAGTAFMIAHTT